MAREKKEFAYERHQALMRATLHDYFMVSYEVRCESREIRMLAEYRYGAEPFQRMLVAFTGVEAYNFQNDCFGNIISEVLEVPTEKILTEKLAEFQEGFRQAGWPSFWRNSVEEARIYLSAQATRGFEIASSYGMSGWVLARDMQMVPGAQSAA